MTRATKGAAVTWIWLRHLRVAGAEGTFCGRLDPAADFTGAAEAAALAAALPADARMLTSPLARARATVEAVAAAGGPGASMETAAEFLEQSFGEWEGRAYADVPEVSAWSIDDYALRAPPRGESFADLCRRVGAAIDRRNALAAGADTGRTLVVCTHAGVVRAALAHALDLPPAKALAFAVDCGSLTRITCIGPADRRIEQVNVTP